MSSNRKRIKNYDELIDKYYVLILGDLKNYQKKKKFNPTNHVIHGFIPAGIRVTALEKLCKLKKTRDTETGYREFFLTSGMFKFEYILSHKLKFPEHVRLTLDYKEDLELAEKIFGELGTNFNIHEVSKLFEQKPELIKSKSCLKCIFIVFSKIFNESVFLPL